MAWSVNRHGHANNVLKREDNSMLYLGRSFCTCFALFLTHIIYYCSALSLSRAGSHAVAYASITILSSYRFSQLGASAGTFSGYT